MHVRQAGHGNHDGVSVTVEGRAGFARHVTHGEPTLIKTVGTLRLGEANLCRAHPPPLHRHAIRPSFLEDSGIL